MSLQKMAKSYTYDELVEKPELLAFIEECWKAKDWVNLLGEAPHEGKVFATKDRREIVFHWNREVEDV